MRQERRGGFELGQIWGVLHRGVGIKTKPARLETPRHKARPHFAERRELKLVIELDGFSHDVQPERDVQRDANLDARGYHELDFTNDDGLQDTEAVALTIQQTIKDLRP